MGDFGKGLRSFKSGLKGPESDADTNADEPIEADVIEVAREKRKATGRKAAKKPAAKKKTANKASAKKAAKR